CHVNSHLTVVDLAQATTPLTLHSHRLLALFGKARGVEDNHTVLFSQLGSYLSREFLHQRLMIPLSTADKMLQVAAILIMAVGNRFHVLPLQVRNQATQIIRGMLTLGRLVKQVGKRLNELGQPLDRSTKYL